MTGKRKTAIARVRMRLGTGQILVNGRPADEYFPREALVGMVNQPIEVASVGGRYDVIASIKGGGVSGQAGALRHGIARAIEKLDPSQRIALKRRRAAHPRRAQEGAQEVRPARGSRALPVLQALGRLLTSSPPAGIAPEPDERRLAGAKLTPLGPAGYKPQDRIFPPSALPNPRFSFIGFGARTPPRAPAVPGCLDDDRCRLGDSR